MELETFNIRLKHVSGKANILADTLSRLVDIDPDARLDPENAGWEFGYYICHASARPPASQSTVPHFPSSIDGARNQIGSKRPRPLELNNQTPLAKSDKAQFGV